MADQQTVQAEIEKLRSMVSGSFWTAPAEIDFKATWAQIKIVGASFKGARFSTQEARESAWTEFQTLVEEVKRRQQSERDAWDRKRSESERLRDQIVALASDIRVSSGIEDLILALATGGASLVLEALLGPFDDRKSELQRLSARLREGWRRLGENKSKMLGRDKQAAFAALNEAKARLDEEWDKYKRERQRVWDEHQRQREQRRSAWRERMEQNIANLVERRERLTRVLAHKESHIEELYAKRADARSDDFRYVVSGWIDEEASAIREIRGKLEQVEEWLYEARSKLTS